MLASKTVQLPFNKRSLFWLCNVWKMIYIHTMLRYLKKIIEKYNYKIVNSLVNFLPNVNILIYY